VKIDRFHWVITDFFAPSPSLCFEVELIGVNRDTTRSKHGGYTTLLFIETSPGRVVCDVLSAPRLWYFIAGVLLLIGIISQISAVNAVRRNTSHQIVPHK
jgi:hypothetical protein